MPVTSPLPSFAPLSRVCESNLFSFPATSWNGWGTAQGTCSVHSWSDGTEDDEGDPPMGRRVNARLGHDEQYYRSSVDAPRFVRRRNSLISSLFRMDDDDDDD